MSNNNAGVAATIDCQMDSVVRSIQWALRRDETSLLHRKEQLGILSVCTYLQFKGDIGCDMGTNLFRLRPLLVPRFQNRTFVVSFVPLTL